MRNDYMFHAVLQKNEEVLRNLLATLLEMDEADIVSCHIENPIELGKKIEGKDCILDVKIKLNDARIINIELQVYKQTYWTNRSLLYWARAFDILKSGQDYSMLLPLLTYFFKLLNSSNSVNARFVYFINTYSDRILNVICLILPFSF